jgi:hypothetical protein
MFKSFMRDVDRMLVQGGREGEEDEDEGKRYQQMALREIDSAVRPAVKRLSMSQEVARWRPSFSNV